MIFYVYLLGNFKKSKLTTYVGHTNDLKKRVSLHNAGRGAKFTRGRKWKIMYIEKYFTKKEAISREYYIKNNRKFRNLLIKKYS